MIFTNSEIVAVVTNLQKVQTSGIHLPGRFGFTIKQNQKRAMEVYKDYLEALTAIGAEKDTPEWKAEVSELLKAETDIPITQISPEPLFDGFYDPALFEWLDFMLKEVENDG